MNTQRFLEQAGLSPEGARAIEAIARTGRHRYLPTTAARTGRAMRAAKREADQRRLDAEEIAEAHALIAARFAH